MGGASSSSPRLPARNLGSQIVFQSAFRPGLSVLKPMPKTMQILVNTMGAVPTIATQSSAVHSARFKKWPQPPTASAMLNKNGMSLSSMPMQRTRHSDKLWSLDVNICALERLATGTKENCALQAVA